MRLKYGKRYLACDHLRYSCKRPLADLFIVICPDTRRKRRKYSNNKVIESPVSIILTFPIKEQGVYEIPHLVTGR